MQRSRKGTRLNDAQYFHQPFPNTRKRMIKMRVMPVLSGKNGIEESDDIKTSRIHRSNGLDRDHPSIEIAWITYSTPTKLIKSSKDPSNYQDVSVEINPEEEISEPPVPEIVGIEEEKFEEQMPVSEKVEEKILPEPEIEIQKIPEEPKIIQTSSENKIVSKKTDATKREEKTSWWKLILEFLGFFWFPRENDKRPKKRRSRKTDTNSLVTAKREDPDIHQNYVSSLEKNEKELRVLDEELRVKKMDSERQKSNENFGMRQTSSPLY